MAVVTEAEKLMTDVTDSRDGGPLPMKFFSTWEVRKVPPNCVSRSCSLTITRLQILQSIEPGLQSVVVSVSMKTPHRSLRSNELEVPDSGTMNIPLNLTFSLEYPHFLKRGGNDLQIRLQRKKRYRNRTIRGYKTLARGEVNMALVLQKSFHGVVKLFSEKNPEPLATVTVSSLTSTPAENETHPTDGASSEEEDEELVFSDELAERGGSDTDSMENIDPSHYEETTTETIPKISLKQPSSVLRLLKLRASGSRGNRRGVPMEVTLGLEEEEEEGGHESVASSLSDSYEEDETIEHDQSTPRPRLRPFFGSDTLSQLSMPQPGDSDKLVEGVFQRYGSLDSATGRGRTRSRSPSESLEPLDMPELALLEGRLWLVKESDSPLLPILHSLGEPFLATPTECTSSSLLSLFNTLHNLWHRANPFLLLIKGDKYFQSALLRAYVTGPYFPIWLYLWSDVERNLRSLTSQDHTSTSEQQYSQQLISQLLAHLKDSLQCHPLPIAQADLLIEATPTDINVPSRSIPFIFNAVMGPWESDTDIGEVVPAPTSPPSTSDQQHQHYEIQLEYWGGKKDSQKSSVKVRSVMVTVVDGPLLSITAIIRKKGGIRIRRLKDSTGETSIMSITASHLSCRSTKNEVITAVVDGVEWQSLTNIKLSAQWNHTSLGMFPRATCQTPPINN